MANNAVANSHNNSSHNNTKVQCHSGRDSPASSQTSPGLSEAYRAMVGLSVAAAGGTRTPSIEQSCCLTETTDCPSDASVITSISTLHGGGGGRRTTSAISPTASSTSSSSSSSCSKERRQDERSGPCRLLLGGSRSQDFRPSAYSRSEEDLIQRVADPPQPGPGRMSLPAATLRNLVRERLREEGISLSSHPYTQSVGPGTPIAPYYPYISDCLVALLYLQACLTTMSLLHMFLSTHP
jgi:hypothetical protein